MEYLLLIFEFFAVKKFRSLFSIVVFPVVLACIIYSLVLSQEHSESISEFQSEIITLLGILLGFTISLFAILISTSGSNIEKAKKTLIGKKLLNKDISIYDILLTGIAYAIILECILLISNVTIPVFLKDQKDIMLFFAINVGLLTHIVVILLRSILDFYFSISKRDNE